TVIRSSVITASSPARVGLFRYRALTQHLSHFISPCIRGTLIRMEIPKVQLLRQITKQPSIPNVASEVRKQWSNSKASGRVRPGMRIAVACGSRGIANHATIAKATVDVLKELGANPFIVAAMGSHG